MDIINAIKTYYNPKKQFSESVIFYSLDYLSCGRWATEKRLAEIKEVSPYAPKLIPKSQYEVFTKAIEEYARRLYQVSCEVKLQSVEVMLSGKRKPLRCTVQLGELKRQFYIKLFNIKSDPRAQGIELLKLYGLIDRRYSFFFDTKFVIEDHVKGRLGADLVLKEKQSSEFKKQAIYFRIVAMLIGLGDIHDHNYVVKSDLRHVPIDFDVMQPYTKEQIKKTHDKLMADYQLSSKDYSLILEEIRLKITDSTISNEKSISQVAAILCLIKPAFKDYFACAKEYVFRS